MRDTERGLEVFCVRRHARSGFLGGALVFPGGKLDPADADPRWRHLATELPPQAATVAGDEAGALGLCVAACRETFEEGGILPVEPHLTTAELDALAAEVQGGVSLLDALARRGLRLALNRLVPFARWVTPEAESRRFDARFFLLAQPPGQAGRHDDRETTQSLWARPLDVLDAAVRGEFFLAPPTSRTLELLTGARDLHAAVTMAGYQSLQPICPRFVPGEGGEAPFLALPGDPAHDVQERRVDGPTRYVLRDGRFVSEDAPGVGRLFASPHEPEVSARADARKKARTSEEGGG